MYFHILQVAMHEATYPLAQAHKTYDLHPLLPEVKRNKPGVQFLGWKGPVPNAISSADCPRAWPCRHQREVALGRPSHVPPRA